MAFILPDAVTIVEVGPRDGLQSEEKYVSTEQKVGFVNALSETGLKRIQMTSFVHPRAVPQLKDAVEVARRIVRKEGVLYSTLVPNETGLQSAIEADVREIEVFVSASESHNMLNINRSVAQTLDTLRPVCEKAKAHGIMIRASIATAFGYTVGDPVQPEQVVRLAKDLIAMGVEEIALGDTVGMANPRQTYELFGIVQNAVPGVRLAAHFHDTRGMGLANCLAALQAGITIFDASVGGLGGCPNTPGASGNVATEDLVNMFHAMGVATGIDLDKLIACARMAGTFVDHPLPGKISQIGACLAGACVSGPCRC